MKKHSLILPFMAGLAGVYSNAIVGANPPAVKRELNRLEAEQRRKHGFDRRTGRRQGEARTKDAKASF